MRLYTRIAAGLLAVIVLMACLPAMAIHTGAATYYHGYESLTTSAQKKVYTLLDNSIRAMEPNVTLPDNLLITSEEVDMICRMIDSDHPEYFWFEGSYSFQYQQLVTSKLVLSVTLNFKVYVDGEAVTERNALWEKAQHRFLATADTILAGVPLGASDYEIALYLYDALARHLRYEVSGNDQNVYGALVEGAAVCSGFAESYQYLLQRCGIDAWSVSGESINSSGQQERHRWNVVWLDGECYYADLTWDEDEERLFHSYFMISGEQMAQNHFMDDVYAVVLPSCNHDNRNYYEMHYGQNSGVGILRDDMAVAEFAEFFLPVDCYGTELTYEAVFCYAGKDFEAWLTSDRHLRLAKELGLKGANSKWYYLNHEYYLIITGPKKSHDIIPPEKISLSHSAVTLTYLGQRLPLIARVLPENASYRLCSFASSDPSVVQVDSETGIMTAVGEGTAYITVCTKENVKAVCTVNVSTRPDHSHNGTLTYVQQLLESCFTDGTLAYYHCTQCDKLYYDAKGLQPVSDPSDLVVPAVGQHSFVWMYDRNGHYLGCEGTNCDARADGSSGDHVDDNQDNRCDTCGYTQQKNDETPVLPENDSQVVKIVIQAAVLAALVIVGVISGAKKKR